VDYTTGDTNDGSGRMAAAITLLVTGALTLTVQFWAGPSHTWDGTNWAAAFLVTSTLLGLGQVLGGLLILFREQLSLRKPSLASAPAQR